VLGSMSTWRSLPLTCKVLMGSSPGSGLIE